MDTLIALNKKDSVIQKIIYHIELFESFENVYLFGSIINEKRTPNDIDLLLIYKDFSSRLLIDLDKISTIFNQLYEISFDLTVLSEHEEDESSFIIRLNSNYLRLK
ncbi:MULTISPECIES: nucleotidyltransferase domain-containing protein [Bacillus cereus group]|uniref:nucleotidyltransferase domain-containing protein n=1 Tax=Bacillus cereus group TaxID=86661 RepID=UPI00159B9B12|nr:MULTISPECIES: nucleotidyltransferase domain-containing protein [Bacillus cereus group]MED2871339.1 nucleotidyltransferase domain-containing protein [Bacillus thuringiensis]